MVVDTHSKWLEVKCLRTLDTGGVIRELREMFSTFGLPLELTADNGPQFRSEEMSRFCLTNGIRLNLVMPYHPESNGLAERAVQTFNTG